MHDTVGRKHVGGDQHGVVDHEDGIGIHKNNTLSTQHRIRFIKFHIFSVDQSVKDMVQQEVLEGVRVGQQSVEVLHFGERRIVGGEHGYERKKRTTTTRTKA